MLSKVSSLIECCQWPVGKKERNEKEKEREMKLREMMIQRHLEEFKGDNSVWI